MTTPTQPIDLHAGERHCWEDRPSVPVGECRDCAAGTCDGKSCWMGVRFSDRGTCMLERDHKGDHDFTDDDRIMIAITEAP
jgi:hypothetical protein